LDLYWIIVIPLLGAVLNGLIIRSKNATISGLIGTVASATSFVLSLQVISHLSESNGRIANDVYTWFSAGRIRVEFLLEVVPVTAIMLMVVTGVGTLIHLYATSYMSHDKTPFRFFAYLNLFLASMLVLVLSGDLVGVFLGWEGVGLCSYLLIGYWFSEDKNAAAGMKAFVTNRIGDLGFLLALMALIASIGTTEIKSVVEALSQPGSAILPWIFLAVTGGIFWASTGKSAQIPLFVWLPDAMAGPTPVSALIHAATMVTSGIFVTVRLWPIFAAQHLVLDVILIVGVCTAWVAALIAVTQNDIKKVLAYSTVSQLGFMFAALGVGSPTAALFHVVTHAFFKALLFLGAGSVIHGVHENQDILKMGGLRKKMPITHLTFLVGTLAIAGFPLTSGFFSKDMILAKAFESSPTVFVVLLGAALLTAFYMFRMYGLTFWGEPRSDDAKKAHESPLLMTLPLAILAILSAFAGWIETPDVIGGIHSLDHWVRSGWYGITVEGHSGHVMSHSLEIILILVTTLASLSVAFFSWKRFSVYSNVGVAKTKSYFQMLSENKFYVDEVYQLIIIDPVSAVASFSSRFIEAGGIDSGVNNVPLIGRICGRVLAVFHNGNIQTYAWFFVVGVACAALLARQVFSW
jgi:NADH-quinone oxidoreductase subunit L